MLQILPAVARFEPDIIFMSAGFDAHKKDDINFHYVGIAEREYEWLTDQIVQVANRCFHLPKQSDVELLFAQNIKRKSQDFYVKFPVWFMGEQTQCADPVNPCMRYMYISIIMIYIYIYM